jgi:hypothetical protein
MSGTGVFSPPSNPVAGVRIAAQSGAPADGRTAMQRGARRPWPPTARLMAVAMAAGIAVAGCGSVRDAGVAGSGPARAGRAPVRPAGGRPEALALARHLLASVRLPAGAVPLGGRPPEVLRHPVGVEASGDSVILHRFWHAPLALAAAGRFLAAHVPGRMEPAGPSTAGTLPPALRGTVPAGRPPRIPDRYVTLRSVTYRPRHAVRGISGASLTVSAATAPDGGSVLRADAQVIWYPRRSAAEYVSPGHPGVVIVSVGLLNPRSHTVTRELRSRAVIGRLARLLNGMPAAPAGVRFCPAITAAYRVAFAASPGARPYLVADDLGCGSVSVVTGCRPARLWAPPARGCEGQPALGDPVGRLITALARLLGVPPRP